MFRVALCSPRFAPEPLLLVGCASLCMLVAEVKAERGGSIARPVWKLVAGARRGCSPPLAEGFTYYVHYRSLHKVGLVRPAVRHHQHWRRPIRQPNTSAPRCAALHRTTHRSRSSFPAPNMSPLRLVAATHIPWPLGVSAAENVVLKHHASPACIAPSTSSSARPRGAYCH